MNNVTDISTPQAQLLRRIASERKFKSWILVTEAEDGELEMIPDGAIGPFVATHMLIQGLYLASEQWTEGDGPDAA